MDDPSLYLDSFLPDTTTPEVSDFSDSLALLEQNHPSTTPLATPSLPTLPTPTALESSTDPSTFTLSDSELTSLLQDPNPSANNSNEILMDDPKSPANSAYTTDDDTIIPAKRRRTTMNTKNEKQFTEPSLPGSPVSSETLSVQDAMSGCSDCDHAHNPLVDGIARAELEKRLKLSAEENNRLRKRVADLMQENRGLRAHAEQVGQAAMAMQAALQQRNMEEGKKEDKGMMVGLATMSKEMAKQLGGMVVVGGKEKKRRRKKVGTAMACVMVVMAAMVGIPDYFNDGKALLALPGSTVVSEKGLVPIKRDVGTMDLPRLCEFVERVNEKKAIADHSSTDKIKVLADDDKSSDGEVSAVDSDMAEGSNLPKLQVSDDENESVDSDQHGEQYSYVLCKDTMKALASVNSCMKAEKEGKACPRDKTISLIMPVPANALGANSQDDNGTQSDGKTVLTEVECRISSVKKLVPRKPNAAVEGRVIATS